jgi:hypothetical protein
MEIYKSDAYERYREFYEWADKHPIKFVEKMLNRKLYFYQKIIILIHHYKEKYEKRKFDKLMERYFR